MAGSVVVIDYGSGNLRSAAKALERAAGELGKGQTVTVTADAAALATADRIVLPGVGAFADCMAGLQALDGMVDALNGAVLDRGVPFLGICVGMQLLAERGLEHGSRDGLGWIPGEVRAIAPNDPEIRIPHMGWNGLAFAPGCHPLLDGIDPGIHVYFVHSYSLVCADPAHVLATVDYAGPLTAVGARDNIVGTQFHPEKSQTAGLHILRNFLGWQP
jgi:glutamine amidotransferase